MISKGNHIKTSVGRRIFIVCNTLLMVLLCAVFLSPYLNVLAQALNDTDREGLGIIPKNFTLASVSYMLQYDGIINAFIVTVLRTLIGSVWAIIVQYAAAYALTQRQLWGKKFVLGLFILPMFISPGVVANMVTYQMLRIVNTFWVLILPSAFFFYNMTVIRIYIQSVSDSYKEAARLDGASEFNIMFRIYMPLSVPIIATVFLWTAVMYWNDWSTNLYYASSPRSERLYCLQYIIQLMQKNENYMKSITEGADHLTGGLQEVAKMDSESLKAAGIVISSLPMLVAYPFLQKFLQKGFPSAVSKSKSIKIGRDKDEENFQTTGSNAFCFGRCGDIRFIRLRGKGRRSRRGNFGHELRVVG